MAKSWMFAILTLTMVACLIGLLAFTGESGHRAPHPVEIGHPISQSAPKARPAAPEREMGPTDQGNGLLLTY